MHYSYFSLRLQKAFPLFADNFIFIFSQGFCLRSPRLPLPSTFLGFKAILTHRLEGMADSESMEVRVRRKVAGDLYHKLYEGNRCFLSHTERIRRIKVD